MILKWGNEWPDVCEVKAWGIDKWGKETKVKNLANGFFLIEFPTSKDKWKFIAKSPYLENGSKVHIRDWCPNLDPWKYKVSENLAWIRLYNILAKYWSTETLKKIGNNMGSFVMTKGIVEDSFWGTLALICISLKEEILTPKEIEI
ncbi:hypothetical protein SUGI_0755780 [Cryptomeria japonica]|nr:hypothetical protein SUGI_0755780 [Cryptomeria japonica]